MRTAGNYSVTFGPEGAPVEQDSFTCHHCNTVIFVKPKQKGEDVGGICKCCMNLICGPCVDKRTCVPFEKKLQEIEDKTRFQRSLGV